MAEENRVPIKNLTFFILLIAAFIFYLFISISSIQEFSIQDEALIETSVAAIQLKGHPSPKNIGFIYPAGDIGGSIPLYYYILASVSHVLGMSKPTFNTCGIFCISITLILLYFIAKEAANGDEKTVLLSCILFITHPMVIQGSVLVEIDNTILILSMNLFLFLYLKLEKMMTANRIFLLGLLFSILLWVKISTTLALPLVILAFNILQNKFKKGAYQAAGIFSLGFFIFIVTWLVYCGFTYDFFFPFIHTFRSVVTHPLNVPFKLGSLATAAGLKEALRLTLWIGPFSIILGLITFTALVKDFLQTKKLSSLYFLALYVLLVWGCYFIIIGTAFGFPRYYLPAMPAFSVCVAAFAVRTLGHIDKRSLVFYCLLGIALAAFYYFGVGDLLYSVNFNLKKTAIFFPTEVYPELKKVILKFILYLLAALPVFIIIKLYKKKAALLKVTVSALLILIFSTNLSLDCLQAKADYNTTYDYGETKKARVINFLRSKMSATDVIIAPVDIPYYLKNKNFIFFDYRIIDTPEKFVATMIDKKVTYVVYGTNSFNLDYYSKVIMSPEVSGYLVKYFKKINMSSYTIWFKNS